MDKTNKILTVASIGIGLATLWPKKSNAKTDVVDTLPPNKQADGDWYLNTVTTWINSTVEYNQILNMLSVSGVDATTTWILNNFNAEVMSRISAPNWALTTIDEYNIITAIVKGLKPTPNNNPTPNPQQSTAHNVVQARINEFMSDPFSLNVLDHVKTGGPSGVKANLKTAQAYVFAWAVANPSGAAVTPPDGPTAYIYPNINAHIDSSASDGLGRGKNGGGGGWIDAALNVIPYVIALL